MKKSLYFGLAALMILLFSLSASAATMDVTWDNFQPVTYTYNDTSVGSQAGEFGVKLFGADWDPFLSTVAYCVDLDNFINVLDDNDLVTLNPVTLDSSEYGSDNYLQAAWLMDTYSAGASLLQEAGLQLAIWDAIYGEDDEGEDLFVNTTTDDIGGHYNYYYGSLSDETWNDAMWSSLGHNYAVTTYGQGINAQKLLVQLDSVPDPVPEPATMLLLGMGIAGLGAAGRKRFRKNNVSGCRS